MILALTSDISEFFQVNHTFYKLDMKILATSNKIRWVGVTLGIYLFHELYICVNKNAYCFATNERSTGNEFKNQYSL